MQNTDPGETWRRSCTGVFWCNPDKLPAGVVAYQRSALRDLDAIKQMAILYSKMAHECEPVQVFGKRRLRATTRRVGGVKSSEVFYNMTKLAFPVVAGFERVVRPQRQTSPEEGSVIIG